MMRTQPQNHHDYQSKDLYDLSALVFNIIRNPTPQIGYFDQNPEIYRRSRSVPSLQEITPSGFASMLLGISLALMLCGLMTFVIGFLLMPWVVGLIVFLYFVRIISTISMTGRALLCCDSAPCSPKDFPSWKLL